ncbi:hypothetical protein [Aquitalea sp. USM4]|uniref:hypothetical protein n=1 Tax=Aquitalea sp. USM4 TaxID=1590041 RepID=UPI00103D0427|nr:hypothetical protein [Aquitalea sp. USM4]QBJ80554.1 hypothetical protein DKK66_20125 [Aquitalea sp. USM4]
MNKQQLDTIRGQLNSNAYYRPSTVKALLDYIDAEREARIKAQKETEQLREDLTKRAQQAQKDAYQRGLADSGMSLKLVADIRFALGDDGKRMQGELVEYCKELRRDAERLRFCQRDPEKGDFAVCKWDWDELSWMPTNTDAIDAAMQTQAPDGDQHGR